MSEKLLLPCPFCGSELKHRTFRIGLESDIWEHPKDTDCPLSKTGIGDPLHIFKSDIEAWNKRHPATEAERDIILANIKEVEAALAQPVQPAQEPVAHCVVRPLRGDQSYPTTEIIWVKGQPIAGPLFTAPPAAQRKPLTDAHLYLASLVEALDGAFISTWQSTEKWQTQLDEARDYLAAHGIKEGT
jgi:hypothetical protein